MRISSENHASFIFNFINDHTLRCKGITDCYRSDNSNGSTERTINFVPLLHYYRLKFVYFSTFKMCRVSFTRCCLCVAVCHKPWSEFQWHWQCVFIAHFVPFKYSYTAASYTFTFIGICICILLNGVERFLT